MGSQEPMKLIRSIATVGFYTLGSRLFGFLRTTLMAGFLGTGVLADAAALALKIPSLLRRIFAEGAMNAAFVPTFSKYLTSEGSESARSYAEEILSLLLFILTLLVIVVEVFMHKLVPFFLPGFKDDPERLSYVIDFTRITFPFILFISLTALYSGVLNSLEKFAAVASSPMMGNIAIIVVAFALLDVTPTAGHAFSYGIIACGIIQWVWVLVPTHRQGMRLRLRWPKLSPRVRHFFILMGPAAAGSGVVQINIFLDMLIASYLPTGGISFLNYAERLNQLPLSMLGTAVGTALLPLLSKQLKKNQYNEAMESQNLALEYSILFTTPALLGLMVLGEPIVKVLYEHGKFSTYDTLETTKTLMALASGLPAYIMIKIFSTSFFAQEDTKTPVLVALGSVFLNLGLNLLFIKPFAHVGLGLATSFAAWMNAVLLGYLLKKRSLFILNNRIKRFLPRALISTALTGIVFWGMMPFLNNLIQSGKSLQILALLMTVILGIGLFTIFSMITGALDMKDLRFQFSNKKSL